MATTNRHTVEKDALRVRWTPTGVMVVEGSCPHCGHLAMDHWPSGCKATEHDHCRMDTPKLARLAFCLDEPGCDGYSHSLTCNDAYFEAIRTRDLPPGEGRDEVLCACGSRTCAHLVRVIRPGGGRA